MQAVKKGQISSTRNLNKNPYYVAYTLLKNELLRQLFVGHREQWISHKIRTMKSGDSTRCDQEPACIQTYHVTC